MFRAVSPSIIRSLRLYIQHQVYVIQVLWLLAKPQNLCDLYVMLYVESYYSACNKNEYQGNFLGVNAAGA